MNKLLFAIGWLLVQPYEPLWAGGESHGGNVVFCPGEAPVLLDYYHAALPNGQGTPQLEALDSLNEDQFLALILEKLDQRWETKSKIIDAWSRVGEVKEWILADLKQLNDSNEPYYLRSGCQRQTGAARQGEMVYRDPVATANLTLGQLSLLRGHEAVYLLATESGLRTSENVLSFFREILRKGPVNSTRLDQALGALKLPKTNFRDLKVGTEFIKKNSSPSIRLEKIGFEKSRVELEFSFLDQREETGFGWVNIIPGSKVSFVCDGISPICQVVPGQNFTNVELRFRDLSWIALVTRDEEMDFFQSNRWIEEKRKAGSLPPRRHPAE